MRLKQQSFVDKYIEKIVLAVGVIIAAAVIYLYVWDNPYSVELTPGQPETWKKVEEKVAQKGKDLDREVKRSTPAPPLIGIKIPDYRGRFWDRYNQKLVASPVYLGPIGSLGTEEIGGTKINPMVDPVIVQAPAATDIKVAVNYYVLENDARLAAALFERFRNRFDAEEAAIRKYADEVAAQIVLMVGKNNPRDFHSATIAGTIDPQARRKLYEAVSEVDGRTPSDWYKNVLEFVTEVELHRQTLDPKTGQWPTDGSFEVIHALPGAAHYQVRNDFINPVVDAKLGKIKDMDHTELQRLVGALVEIMRSQGKDIVEPEFLPVKAHREWTPPDHEVIQLSDEDQKKLFELNKGIKKLESDIRQLQARAAAQTLPGAVGPGSGRPEEGYPGAKGPVRTPPRVAPPPRPTPGKAAAPGTPPQPQGNQLEERIKVAQDKLLDLLKQKDLLINKPDPNKPVDPTRVGPEGVIRPRDPAFRDPRDPAFRDPRFDPSRQPGVRPRIGPDGQLIPGTGELDAALAPIKFWAHDVTVEAGKTYRYRVVYKVINPLFNKDAELVAEKKDKAKELEQASIPSAWTEPVKIESMLQYFVEDVNASTSTAMVGVYKIYNGQRIYKQFPVRPGDPVGKTKVTMEVPDDEGAKTSMAVDLQVPAVLVDVKMPPRQPGAIGVRGPISVLLANLTDGSFEVRDPAVDQANVDRVRMKNEVDGATAVTPGTPGTPGSPFPGVPLPPERPLTPPIAPR